MDIGCFFANRTRDAGKVEMDVRSSPTLVHRSAKPRLACQSSLEQHVAFSDASSRFLLGTQHSTVSNSKRRCVEWLFLGHVRGEPFHAFFAEKVVTVISSEDVSIHLLCVSEKVLNLLVSLPLVVLLALARWLPTLLGTPEVSPWADGSDNVAHTCLERAPGHLISALWLRIPTGLQLLLACPIVFISGLLRNLFVMTCLASVCAAGSGAFCMGRGSCLDPLAWGFVQDGAGEVMVLVFNSILPC